MSNVGKRGKLKLETRLSDAARKGTGTRLSHHEVERVLAALRITRNMGLALQSGLRP